jgi:hypothetical protein
MQVTIRQSIKNNNVMRKKISVSLCWHKYCIENVIGGFYIYRICLHIGKQRWLSVPVVSSVYKLQIVVICVG